MCPGPCPRPPEPRIAHAAETDRPLSQPTIRQATGTARERERQPGGLSRVTPETAVEGCLSLSHSDSRQERGWLP